MARIRAFEEAAEVASIGGVQVFGATASSSAKVRGPLHLSIGQEAVPAGVCAHLQRADLLTSTHRGHGHTLAKGADVQRMMAELFGKSGGSKGGSMHIADFSVGMLGANGVVAAGLPIACGAAHALKIRRQPQIVACFFGDGAINRGPFLEALNWAAVYSLPVLFVCEDNRYSATTESAPMTAGEGAATRARAIGVAAEVVDGNDVAAVSALAARLIDDVRSGAGPRLLHARTWRVKGHVSVDGQGYRDAADIAAARQIDPLLRARAAAASGSARGGDRHDRCSSARRDRRCAGLRRGLAATRSGSRVHRRADAGSRHMAVSIMSCARAGAAALALAMHEDPNVVALGEDLGRGGIFGQYTGLLQRFGAERIIDTPISESTLMGAGVGMALAGLRPVVEMRVADFAMCAMDEIVNQAAKNRYMFGGQGRVPLVARLPIGVWGSSAAQHSQSFEAWFVHLPGVVVLCPSTPQDSFSMLRAALRGDHPVIYMEHKELWSLKGEVDDEQVPALGRARVLRRGEMLTIVSWSAAVHQVSAAAEALAAEGISASVIDLGTLWPWDRDAVLADAARTGHLLVVHEAVQAAGFGAEVAATAAQHTGCRVARLGAPRVPVGYAPVLEAQARVDAARVVQAARAMLAR